LFQNSGERITAIWAVTIISVAFIIMNPMIGRPSLRWHTGAGVATTAAVSSCPNAQHTPGGPDSWGGCWPADFSTGYPHSLPGDTRSPVSLSSYGGSCTISTNGTTLDSQNINCPSGLTITGLNVTITNSLITGYVRVETDVSASTKSLTLTDVEVDAGTTQIAAVCCGNTVLTRVNSHGGVTAVQCEELAVYPCTITDSYLHGQYIPDDQPWHLGGFLSDGSSAGITIQHSYVACDHAVNSVAEGCTGDINFIPNFAPISGATVYRNLFYGSDQLSYCFTGGEKASSPTPHSDHITVTDNVFQRGVSNVCGDFGPWTDWDVTQPGNSWTNNRYDDGTVIPGT